MKKIYIVAGVVTVLLIVQFWHKDAPQAIVHFVHLYMPKIY